jgi:hypothetical protein
MEITEEEYLQRPTAAPPMSAPAVGAVVAMAAAAIGNGERRDRCRTMTVAVEAADGCNPLVVAAVSCNDNKVDTPGMCLVVVAVATMSVVVGGARWQ